MSQDYPKIRAIRYLGSKRKLVDKICNVIASKVPQGSTVLDMFAGTNCVAYGLKNRFRVYSNDVQMFSYIVAKAVLMNKRQITASETRNDLEQMYRQNLKALQSRYKKALAAESAALNLPSDQFRQYADFCSSFKQTSNAADCPSKAHSNDADVRRSRARLPYDLFTWYFSNNYFGLKQCLQIDSLRFAIDSLDHADEQKKDLYLCALIYSLDSCVASPGHFAQFFRPHSKESFATIAEERKKDVKGLFYATVKYLEENLASSDFDHEAWCADYTDLFNANGVFHNKMKDVDLIYADPPYTADHYSRFYHVLETLIRYDYPEAEGKGLYRTDRFKSNFSLRSKAYAEFERLFSSVSSLGCKLLVSYNNDGLIHPPQLMELCNRHFTQVQLDDIKYNHSNQGRRNEDCSKRRNPRKEYLVYCAN